MEKQCKFSIDYDEGDFGAYHWNKYEVTINPTNIKNDFDTYETDFYTLLLHVINHEFLHHIIYVEHGKHVSLALDSITHGKQRNEKIWDYWLS